MIIPEDHSREIPDGDPIKKFILLVLLQVQEDGATDLVFGVPAMDDAGSPIRYKVAGSWYEMNPFPPHIRPAVVAELERMAGLSADVRSGILDQSVGAIRFRWKVQMTTTEAECVLTPVGE